MSKVSKRLANKRARGAGEQLEAGFDAATSSSDQPVLDPPAPAPKRRVGAKLATGAKGKAKASAQRQDVVELPGSEGTEGNVVTDQEVTAVASAGMDRQSIEELVSECFNKLLANHSATVDKAQGRNEDVQGTDETDHYDYDDDMLDDTFLKGRIPHLQLLALTLTQKSNRELLVVFLWK